MKEVFLDNEMIKKMSNAKSIAELINMFRGAGVDITEEQEKELTEKIRENGFFSDEQ